MSPSDDLRSGGTVAIDLGSTTTVVAHQAPGEPPRLLDLSPYSLGDPAVVPSLLWLPGPDAGAALLGRQVLDAGLESSEAPQLQRDFKRWIGAGNARPGSAGQAERAGALLLSSLWRRLSRQLQPERLVLTAPVETYAGYRHWLLQACSALAVPEVALVDEPTAAAIGAGLPPGSTVLVVDLGGGTIDLSLVQLQGGEGRAAPIAQLLRFAGRDLSDSRQQLRCARVIGKAGLTLGGRDIDRWIAAALCPDLPPQGGLLLACERLKCALSETEQALTLWSPAEGAARELRLDRPGLDALLEQRGLLEQLDQLLEEVLAAGRAAGVAREAITAVLPVGGSSRLPAVQQWLATRCAGLALRQERPVEAVALGALALTPNVQLKDVLSRGVSLRCWDRRSRQHHWHPLFVAGQSWPTERPLELVLACSRDDQPALELMLAEPLGERRREVVFEGGVPVLRQREAGAAAVTPWSEQPAPLRLEPPGRAGDDRLRLRFSIDAEGQLQLQRQDLLTGAEHAAIRLGRVR